MPLLKNNDKAILIAGLTTLFATFQLVMTNIYTVIFLEEDLLTTIFIITVIITLRNLLQLAFRVPLGELSQIIGRKPLIICGHFSYTIALTLMFLARDWLLVLLAILFIALGMSAFWSSLFAFVGDLTPDNFGESNGRIFQFTDMGVMSGSLLAKFLLDELLWELRDLFGVVAVIGVLTGLFSIIILPESLEKTQKKQVASIPKAILGAFFSMVDSLKEATRTKDLIHVYMFQFLLAFTEYMATTFLPVLIVKRGFTRGEVSEIIFWSTLAIIWFKPSLGRITDKFDFIYTSSITLLLSCCIILIFPSVQDFWLLVVLYICLNSALITAYTATNGATSKRAPFKMRGTALGALGFYVSFGRTTSTMTLGPIWDAIGLVEVFYVTAIGMILVSVLLFLYTRSKENSVINSLSE